MKAKILFNIVFCITISVQQLSAVQADTISTSKGDLIIQFIGKEIHIDPYSHLADYATLPKADLILITHGHPDHLDSVAISKIEKNNTVLIFTQACKDAYTFNGKSIVMGNGDKLDVLGIHIDAVPSYGIAAKRPDGQLFHPKGVGNGYILTIGGKRIYVAGDTENIPEMKTLGPVDIAFLPMNLPYTMTPEQMANAAQILHPKVLYPYHFGDSDVAKLVELLKDLPEIEIRIRNMK
jgi:L-ascorbate metabolism protein UlaG (beta-lactamase superfamily)